MHNSWRSSHSTMFVCVCMCVFVCLWFFVPLQNFSLIWRRHHNRWRAENLNYARHLLLKSIEGSLVCYTYCYTGHPFIMVISENPWHPQRSNPPPRFNSTMNYSESMIYETSCYTMNLTCFLLNFLYTFDVCMIAKTTTLFNCKQMQDKSHRAVKTCNQSHLAFQAYFLNIIF